MTKLQDFLNSPVAAVTRMGRNPKAGDVYGLELECEGRNVDHDGTWLNHICSHKPGSANSDE